MPFGSPRSPSSVSVVPDRLIAGGGESVLPWYAATQNDRSVSSGTLKLMYFTAQRSEIIKSLKVMTGSAGFGTPTFFKMAAFAVDSNNDAAMITSTANDPTSTPVNTGALSIVRNLLADWSKVAGQDYALAVLGVSSSGATMTGVSMATSADSVFGGKRKAGILTGQTDIPSSIPSSALTNTSILIQMLALPGTA